MGKCMGFGPSRNSIRRKAILLATVGWAACSGANGSTTRSWVGPSGGNWDTAANWSPSGVPQIGEPGDNVILGNMDPDNLVLSYTAVVNSPFDAEQGLNSITVNSSGSLPFAMIVDETTTIAADTDILCTTESIGTTLSSLGNQWTQGQSTANTAGTLLMSVGSGTVNNSYLMTGSESALTVTSICSIGVAGAATFTQTGGTATFDNGGVSTVELQLGVDSTGAGVVNVSNATMQADAIAVGVAGTASFTMTSGALLCDYLSVSSTSATATFNDSGGTFTGFNNATPAITVGTNGTFNLQTGTTLNSQSINITTGGTFNMSGGVLATFAGVAVNGGTFNLLGTNVALVADNTGDGSGFDGGTSGLIQNGSTVSAVLTINDPEFFSGATLTFVQYDGSFANGGAGSLGLTLAAGGGIQLGTTGSGASSTYSGPTTLQGELIAGFNGVLSPNSSVILAGGTLQAGTVTNTVQSISGTGGVVQIGTGGVLTTGAVSSTFGGVLTGSGTLTKSGTGTFTLTGGGSFTGTINLQQGLLVDGAVNGIPTGASLALIGTGALLQINANQSVAEFASTSANTAIFANSSTLTFGSGNLPTTLGGIFSGAGTLVKVGTGTTTIGFGSGDAVSAADTSLLVNVAAGTLALAKSPSSNAIGGPLTISGGSVLETASNQIADTSVVTINSGNLNLAGFNETVGGLAGTSPGNVLLAGGTLTVAQTSTTSYGGGISGPGAFNKNGAGTLTLSGAGSFTGSFTANGGLLVLPGSQSATAFVANSGGTMQLNAGSINLAGSPIVANAGGTVQYSNETISNGFLRGGGAHVILAGGTSTFNGITTFNSTTITQNGAANFNDFSNGGTLNINAPLNFNGGVNSGTGIINVSNAFNTQDFGNQGVINVSAGATITNSSSDFYLEGGARMFIGSAATPGGTLTLQGGTTLEVNGALLVNSGTISGTTDVNYGGTAQGAGTYGPVNVTDGGLFQPGFTSGGASIPSQGAIISSLTGDGAVDNQSAGGSLTLTDNSASVSTFSGVIQNSTGTLGVVLSGPGGLTLLTTALPGGGQSTNSYSGGTTISGGTLTIGAAGALPAGGNVANNGVFNVFANSVSGQITGNGALNVGESSTLKIASSTGISTQGSLAIDGGATLDVTNNEFLVQYGRSADPISAIQSYLASGYNSGTWAGVGINSSAVAGLDSSQKTLIYSVGYADGADGIVTGLSSGQIEILPTLAGDAKLQGNVVFGDFQLLAQYFGHANTSWDEGDFTYNGTTNFGDFQMLAQDFGSSSSALTAAEISSLQSFAAENGETLLANPNGVGFTVVSVPEPASIAIIGLATAVLAGRKRSRRVA